MALIQCRECGRDISDQTLTCPHCGGHTLAWEQRKEAKRIRNCKFLFNLLSAILILTLAAGVYGTYIWLPYIVSKWGSYRLDGGNIVEIGLSLCGFFIVCYAVTIKRPRIFKVVSFSFLGVFLISCLVYIGVNYVTDVIPKHKFIDSYYNANSLQNLQDKILVTEDDVKITFNGDQAYLKGDGLDLRLKVDSVSEGGEIFIPCEYTELKQLLSDNSFEKYFYTSKIRHCNKGIGCFSLTPSYYGTFRLSYNDYYFVAPKLELRPTYKHWNSSVGDIASGVTVSSADNANAGWYEIVWRHKNCRIIQK